MCNYRKPVQIMAADGTITHVLRCADYDSPEFGTDVLPEQINICDTQKSRGLGDTIAKVAKKIGFKKPCSACSKRQEILNQWFPYQQ